MTLKLLTVVALYHGTLLCCGFNIDERFPVIKEGFTKGSFFGFSVALHQQTEGTRKYLLLAGAPKEKASSLPNVNETGAVYSCPITTDSNDCTRMDLLTSTNPSEMVEGMWLGVTVATQRDQQPGRVLACGHRYVKIVPGGTEEQRRMIGKCFVRGNDLTFDPSDDWQTHKYEMCDPNRDMESEGMCSMGISGGMTDTDVYLGATGSYLWQGNVHITWRNPSPSMSWDSVDKNFGQLVRYRYSYMGYSVIEEKKLLSLDDYTVLSGAPRDESKGSVLFGKKSDTSMEIVLVIPGEQVGSYFGNSLAVTDLNNDDWNDLIVGAPFYFDRMKERGGAVYIYMNENGSFQKTPKLVLTGPAASGFGFALAALGDINQDGFQDFAVGAPFYETGQVYVWTGSKQGISEKPSQVIEGKSIGAGFTTFGYSINGGMDMDENSYPDILVGSLDDHIALLRSRPVIHLTKDITVEPKIVDPNQCVNQPCITATVCMSFTLSNGNKNFKRTINVKYTIEADMDTRKSARVVFQDNNADFYTDVLALTASKTECQTLKLSVVVPLRDKLEPVVFSLNVSINEQKPKSRRSLQNLDAYPIFSQEQKLTQRTEINFLKECGTDNICSSNLQLTAQYVDDKETPYPRQGNFQVFQYSSDIRYIWLLVEVTNVPSGSKLAEDAHQAELNVTIPEALRYSGVRSEGHSVECSLEETLMCELGNPLKGNSKVSLTLIFETSGIDLYTHKIISQLLLSTVSNQNDLLPVPFGLLIENTIRPSFSIVNPLVQTQFSGTVKGESAMVNSSDVGSLVEFTFNVNVGGQSLGDLATLAVEFEWPAEVTSGKWLLYLTKITVATDSETECTPPGDIVNPLNLTLSETSKKRTKRQVVVDDENNQPMIIEPQAAITLHAPRKESFLLDCSKGTARCWTFTCPLLNMTNSAQIYVRSRLWNGTMLEDYSNALRVEVRGHAFLKLITDKPTIKMDPQSTEFRVQIDPLEDVETQYELPLWIIISAAVAGIVLLGIIILILWKCGFFQRASRREMYEAKAQKAEMKIQPSETERLTEDY
ncbi:integrin alpha-3b [Periophthalmus magnuspinnatus]|uniref:integrin alpha-3b n=1 Tax=Periophthalmus magnuspinnatus TaxID=409849 RepID=UPI00145AE80A|nr:integrin alpha-3b [Periophthalmus magnuspinnatus]